MTNNNKQGFDRGSRDAPSKPWSSSPLPLVLGKNAPSSPGTPGAWFPYRDRTPRVAVTFTEKGLGRKTPQLSPVMFQGGTILTQQEAMVIWNRSLQNSTESVPSAEDLQASMVEIGVCDSVIERVMVSFDMDQCCERDDAAAALCFQRSYFHISNGTVCGGSGASTPVSNINVALEKQSGAMESKENNSNSNCCVFCSLKAGPIGPDEIFAISSGQGTISPCVRCGTRSL
eukprot:CAMPEP_0114559564 /NCGR_PEP_ID=MMETSP0114-20121206/10986_1 /TAXON_ID=31324 /ORGANISM="Goniomonas sp, Strain m" /LENGTH=229 /DNA_ID=CAMNT_0001745037 /DNA_START=25 /DNA_END=714 /DNA_ORIENTATION=+